MIKNNELMHYSVLGMKWGIRRGHADTAYAKGSKKLYRIQNKNLRIQRKMDKKIRRVAKAHDPNDEKNMNRKEDIKRLSAKSLKQMRKAEKWVKKMDKAFTNTPYELTKEMRDIGEQYVGVLNTRKNKIMAETLY